MHYYRSEILFIKRKKRAILSDSRAIYLTAGNKSDSKDIYLILESFAWQQSYLPGIMMTYLTPGPFIRDKDHLHNISTIHLAAGPFTWQQDNLPDSKINYLTVFFPDRSTIYLIEDPFT